MLILVKQLTLVQKLIYFYTAIKSYDMNMLLIQQLIRMGRDAIIFSHHPVYQNCCGNFSSYFYES